jgi:hypothetical protein
VTLSTFLLGALLAVAEPPSAAAPSPAPAQCVTDREALMALNIHAFDQDLNGGWRPIAAREECVDEAADLIRDYRKFVTWRTLILYWHEGQLRAQLGGTEAAIALFEQSRYPPANDEYGWNHYVDATIAFLRQNRPALEAARGRLAKAKIPDFPADWSGSRGPMNLDVVDGLLRCFGRSYKEAYSAEECRPPAPR